MKQNKDTLFIVLCIVSMLAMVTYIVVKTMMIVSAEYQGMDRFFSVIHISGEIFIIVHAVGYGLNTLRVFLNKGKRQEKAAIKIAADQDGPSVAILVAARHEPKSVLASTFNSLVNLNYKNKNIYFLDDSSDDDFKKEADELAIKYDLKLLRRDEREGAKAGIINACLKGEQDSKSGLKMYCRREKRGDELSANPFIEGLTEKYIVIFDADQCPLPVFLSPLIPLMEKDEKLAFIQTPQYYSNLAESRIARAATFQQTIFYEYICEGKSLSGAMFCCGTNVIFRREALLDVGGFDSSSVTEDFATSFRLHSRGWKSLYYKNVYTFGMGPEDLASYFKQQFRWANGTVTVFKKLVWLLFTKPLSLSLSQWYEYFLSSTWYFVGFAYLFLMVAPLVYIIFGISSFYPDPLLYFSTFIPAIIFMMAAFYLGVKMRGYKIIDILHGQLLSLCTFYVYIKAALAALLCFKTTFGITAKGKARSISYNHLLPQLILMCFTLTAVIWGSVIAAQEKTVSISINLFWVLYHLILLFFLFYFNEEELGKISCSKLPKPVTFTYKLIEKISDVDGFSKYAYSHRFAVSLPERHEIATVLMCKLQLQNGDAIIFDGNVLWASEKKKSNGFEVGIGISKISNSNIKKLRKVILK